MLLSLLVVLSTILKEHEQIMYVWYTWFLELKKRLPVVPYVHHWVTISSSTVFWDRSLLPIGSIRLSFLISNVKDHEGLTNV